MSKIKATQRKHLQKRQPSSPEKPSLILEQDAKRFWIGTVLGAVLLFVVTFAIYLPSMNGPFIMDDGPKITLNPDIKGDWSHVFSRLIYPYEEVRKFERNDPSRPLVYLSLALNYHTAKLDEKGNPDPQGFHIFNVFFHFLNTLLVWAMMQILWLMAFKKQTNFFPFLGAMFYAVHPLNTSTVSYVFSRSDLLTTFFFLSSLWLFAAAFTGKKRRYWAYALSLFCFIPAFYSKQLAATLPLTLLLFDFLFIANMKGCDLLKRAGYHIAYWVLLAIFMIGRVLYFGGMGDLEAIGPLPAGPYFITQPFAIMKYLQMLLVPVGLSIDHGIGPASSLLEPKIIASWLGVLALFTAIFMAYRRKTDAAKLVVFCLSWFIVTISPTSSFLPTTAIVVDNRVYLPGLAWVGLLMLVYYIWAGKDAEAWKSKRHVFPLTVAVLHLIVLGGLAVQRNRIFSDSLTVWQDAANRYPNNSRAHLAIAGIYKERGAIDAAVEEFEKAVTVDPRRPNVHNDLGLIFYQQRKVDLAIAEFNAELRVRAELGESSPDNAAVHKNLANAYYSQHQYPQAIGQYQKAISLDPKFQQAYFELGTLFLDINDYDNAALMYSKSLEMNPNQPMLHNNLGVIYMNQGENEKALTEFLAAKDGDAKFANAYKNLAVIYTRLNQPEKVLEMESELRQLSAGQ